MRRYGNRLHQYNAGNVILHQYILLQGIVCSAFDNILLPAVCSWGRESQYYSTTLSTVRLHLPFDYYYFYNIYRSTTTTTDVIYLDYYLIHLPFYYY
ncbi:hypothetical protein DPMN_057039 [Dreissena polymorpha]|uniref:Uncharacterized protein n=1 Tax=Dreissena polymorpha TaxID=45954 RepID=A0A9D4HTT2_DREPO|nr:hypothetical protein DPMN_057039 [Dreissena polymorpha]